VLTVCLASTKQYIYLTFLERLNTVREGGGIGWKAERYFLATTYFSKSFLPLLSVLFARKELSFRLSSICIGQNRS